jgi:zinc transport system ATP-binding protein
MGVTGLNLQHAPRAPSPAGPLVELRGVEFHYGEALVLEDIDFRVEPGEYVGIIGPNGSGKTTLVRLILGLAPPTAGQVRLFGEPPATFRQWERLGYVPQRVVLDPALPATVEEVVETGLLPTLGWGRRPGARLRAHVRDVLGQLGLERLAAARVGTLSVGQQQRVLIARALVSAPELLILDEPTGHVDPEMQTSFYTLLRHLHLERRVTLVLVSHDIGVVAREVTKLACLNRRLVFHGPPADFLTDTGLAALYGPGVGVVAHGHR